MPRNIYKLAASLFISPSRVNRCIWLEMVCNGDKQILNLLGKEAPLTSDPSKYIRYIYNRVILENANVRASAVSALANFGAKVEGLRFRIQTLLKRCLFDSDDEVRDRATFYLRLLEVNDQDGSEPDWGIKYFTTTQKYPLGALENTLREYLAGDKTERFDSASIPTTHDFSIAADVTQGITTAAITSSFFKKKNRDSSF